MHVADFIKMKPALQLPLAALFAGSLIFICKCRWVSLVKNSWWQGVSPTLTLFSSLQDLGQGAAYLGTQPGKDLKRDLLKVPEDEAGCRHTHAKAFSNQSFSGLQAGPATRCPCQGALRGSHGVWQFSVWVGQEFSNSFKFSY